MATANSGLNGWDICLYWQNEIQESNVDLPPFLQKKGRNYDTTCFLLRGYQVGTRNYPNNGVKFLDR